ncbi:MAG: helix-turn-helix domain-containing protein [Phycisphaerales bacterium]
MPRPSQLAEKRRALLPTVAKAFSELGYRRATTGELAARCGVGENILYRLWPDKKAMFIAAIGYVYDLSAESWLRVLSRPDGERSTASRLLAHEADAMGTQGHHRIVFAGLNETDDPEIRAALAGMYQRYQSFVRDQVMTHRQHQGRERPSRARSARPAPARAASEDATARAWAVIGLATVANITRELGLLDDASRRRVMARMGNLLLDAAAE